MLAHGLIVGLIAFWALCTLVMAAMVVWDWWEWWLDRSAARRIDAHERDLWVRMEVERVEQQHVLAELDAIWQLPARSPR